MFVTIALLLFLLLLLLLLRPSPTVSTPQLIPLSPPHSRHVSFSLVSIGPSYSLPTSQSLSQRRWSPPFHKRKALAPDSPRVPQSDVAPATPVDQFGRFLSASSTAHPPPKPSRRLSTSLRLSFTGKRRSSVTSCTSTLEQVNISPPSSTSETQSPLQRTRFANPFTKHSRSRTLSPPSTLKPLDMPSCPSSMSSPSSPPARRRVLIDRFKSIFKFTPPDPNPTKPIFITGLRRKPVARTQPYGPPWNAPMPVPDFDLFQHPFQKPPQTMSSPLQNSRNRSDRRSRPEIASMSPGQLSPRTFINELDEKLSLLQQQRTQDSILSPYR